MNELEDYVRIRRPVYEDMLIALDYQIQEIESLKQLIEHYEEEHSTTFKLWQDTIKQQQELKKWLEERIITIEDTPTYTFVGSLGKTIRVNDEIINQLVEVLERLG